MATDKGPVTLNEVLICLDSSRRPLAEIPGWLKAEGYEEILGVQIAEIVEYGVANGLIDSDHDDKDGEPLDYFTTEAGRSTIVYDELPRDGEQGKADGHEVDPLLNLNPPPVKEENPQPSKKEETEAMLELGSDLHKLILQWYRFGVPSHRQMNDQELAKMPLSKAREYQKGLEQFLRDRNENWFNHQLKKVNRPLLDQLMRLEQESEELVVAKQEIDRLMRDLELEKQKVKEPVKADSPELKTRDQEINRLKNANESLGKLAELRKTDAETVRKEKLGLQAQVEELQLRVAGSAAMIAEYEAAASLSPTPPVLLPPALPPVPGKTPEAAPKAEEGMKVPPIIRAELPVAVSQKNNDWIGWILVSAVAIACAVGGWLM